ncbi:MULTISPECIES: hypothetical protein [unclassified Streptomyces]|uniref:DUF7848 domain-containing protein n=1 Tax=unclassified Streptomyces TaxID=2593676 RepID=UPI000CD55515|nr:MULTISPECIES: hypothetical protein [unclassified Streptomyces]
MNGVVGWAGCWWWGTRNWWRLLGWSARTSRARAGTAAPGIGRVDRVAMHGPVAALPDEVALLARIFGSENADGASGLPSDPVAGEQVHRFGQLELITGVRAYWTACEVCDECSPDAGTADAALAWVVVHMAAYAGHRTYRLEATAPVRTRPAPVR